MTKLNAFQLPVPEYLTVKSLREHLDAMQASWTEKDIRYLGEFELTPIRCIYYPKDTLHNGVGNATIMYDGGLGFIIVQKEEE